MTDSEITRIVADACVKASNKAWNEIDRKYASTNINGSVIP